MMTRLKRIAAWTLIVLGVLLALASFVPVEGEEAQGGAKVILVAAALLGAMGFLLLRKAKTPYRTQEHLGGGVYVTRKQDGPTPRSLFKTTYRFHADYFVYTPLDSLNSDGKTVAVNSEDDLPHMYGGSWLSPDIISRGRCWDGPGSINGQKAEEYKQFLIVFRAICEDPGGTPSEKLDRLKALGKDSRWKKWYKSTEKEYENTSLTFPDLALWYDLARQAGCDVHQAASLIAAGYETIEQIAEADYDSIKKLPRFGPKSTPKVINNARKKLGMPELVA